MGTPGSTQALGKGLGGFNLQLVAPWIDRGINRTAVKQMLRTRGGARRLLSTAQQGHSEVAGADQELSDDELDMTLDAKTESGYVFQGALFYALLGLASMALLHGACVGAISYAAGKGCRSVMASSLLAFPNWEIATFHAEWNGVATAAVMAMAHHCASFMGGMDAAYITGCSAIMIMVQTPWLLFHFWWLHKHVRGPHPSVAFRTEPVVRVCASRPTLNILSLCDWQSVVDHWDVLKLVWKVGLWLIQA